MSDHVRIFDTTLRDGEQSPGNSMNMAEKLQMAHQLARLNVDVIEAGFPASSPGDFESVRLIAREVRGPVICALARTGDADIDAAHQALREAERGRIHTFIATSPIHMEYKLRMRPEEVLAEAVRAVARARGYVEDVEFSCEDATRSDPEFLLRVYQAAIDAGATTLNVPDTVGYSMPNEYGGLFAYLRANLRGAESVVFSAHCHNDLGVAVANSLAAVSAGARQIECAVNGIGERAGNTPLEEVVMALEMRRDIHGTTTRLVTQQLYQTSQMLVSVTGNPVARGKAIVGRNAFAHEAGIHQDGVLKNAQTYEIMKPEDVGVASNELPLGKHSGRSGLRERFAKMGIDLSQEDLNRIFSRFKELADRKKEVHNDDLLVLFADYLGRTRNPRFNLVSLTVQSGTLGVPNALVRVRCDHMPRDAAEDGDGPFDAVISAIKQATRMTDVETAVTVIPIGPGSNALGEVVVQAKKNGWTAKGKSGDTDLIVACGKACIEALNRLVVMIEAGEDSLIQAS